MAPHEGGDGDGHGRDNHNANEERIPEYIQDGLQSEENLGNMLDLQLQLVWPLELPFLERIVSISTETKVLDVACGQGSFAKKMADHLGARVHGVDLEASNIAAAKRRHVDLANNDDDKQRLTFETANAYDLSSFRNMDVATCRSMLYTVPNPEKIVSQILQTLRTDGGVAHFFCEDYGMMFASPCHDNDHLDLEAFWREGPCTFLRSQGCNPHMARSIYGIASQAVKNLGLQARVEVATVPITTCPANGDPGMEVFYRTTLGKIFQTWKDYAPPISANSSLSEEYVCDCFDAFTKACNDPDAWVSWQCTICTVRLLV
jgi:2-polyprenyl-3-methyl-5-hydroxy-6-metoxy-1,4-benzoquinol methylase